MGSYDHLHAGTRCGQIKCWGKSYDEIVAGDHVTLHRQLTAEQLAELEADGATGDEIAAACFAGVAAPGADHQVALTDGSYAVVRDGVYTGIVEHADTGVEIVGNNGHSDGRPAHIGEPGDCEICATLR